MSACRVSLRKSHPAWTAPVKPVATSPTTAPPHACSPAVRNYETSATPARMAALHAGVATFHLPSARRHRGRPSGMGCRAGIDMPTGHHTHHVKFPVQFQITPKPRVSHVVRARDAAVRICAKRSPWRCDVRLGKKAGRRAALVRDTSECQSGYRLTGCRSARDFDWVVPMVSSNHAEMHLPLVSILNELGDAACTSCPSGAVSLDISPVPAYGPVESSYSSAQ